MGLLQFPKRRRGEYGKGTITPRSDGRFRVQVSGGFDARTGRRLRPGGYTATLEEAERLRAQLLARVATLDEAPDAETEADETVKTLEQWTVGEWLDEWMTRRSTVDTSVDFRKNKSGHVKDHPGHLGLADLRARHVRKLVNETLAKTHCAGRRGLSPQTRDHVLDVLRAALEEAVYDDEVNLPKNVAKRVKVKDYDPSDFNPRVLSDTEYESFLAAAARHDGLRRSSPGRRELIVPLEEPLRARL